jgi:hypothetical protein
MSGIVHWAPASAQRKIHSEIQNPFGNGKTHYKTTLVHFKMQTHSEMQNPIRNATTHSERKTHLRMRLYPPIPTGLGSSFWLRFLISKGNLHLQMDFSIVYSRVTYLGVARSHLAIGAHIRNGTRETFWRTWAVVSASALTLMLPAGSPPKSLPKTHYEWKNPFQLILHFEMGSHGVAHF